MGNVDDYADSVWEGVDMTTKPMYERHLEGYGPTPLDLASVIQPPAPFESLTGTFTPTRPTRRLSDTVLLPVRPHDQPDEALYTTDSQLRPATPPKVATLSPDGTTTPWIGGTGLGSTGLGKSGRVIERLMAENDRLRREMKAEIAKREEAQRAVQTQKPRLEYLQTENSRLTNAKAHDDGIIQRRDRKIEELKSDLDAERQRRKLGEQRAHDAERQRDQCQEISRSETQAAQEQARHATIHAEILQTSHQQLSKEYKQRVATTVKAIKDLTDERDQDRKKLAKLDVVTDQMRHESETMRRSVADLTNACNRFRKEKAQQFNDYETEADTMRSTLTTANARNQKLQDDLSDTVGRMRWVMALDKLETNSGRQPRNDTET